MIQKEGEHSNESDSEDDSSLSLSSESSKSPKSSFTFGSGVCKTKGSSFFTSSSSSTRFSIQNSITFFWLDVLRRFHFGNHFSGSQFSKNSKPTSFSTSNVREDPLQRSAYSDCLHFSNLAHLPPPVRYPEEEIAPFPVPRPAAGVHVGLCAVDIFCVFNKHPVNDILIQSTSPSNTPSPFRALQLLLFHRIISQRLQLIKIALIHASRHLRLTLPLLSHIFPIKARALKRLGRRSVYAITASSPRSHTTPHRDTPASSPPSSDRARNRPRSPRPPPFRSSERRSIRVASAYRFHTRCRTESAAPPTLRTHGSLLRGESRPPASSSCCRARSNRPPPAPTVLSPRPIKNRGFFWNLHGWGCA